jgi:hypothetical protein
MYQEIGKGFITTITRKSWEVIIPQGGSNHPQGDLVEKYVAN